MNNNKIWIFLVLAVVTGAVLFVLLLGTGQESLEQTYGLDLPEPFQTSTINSPAAGKPGPLATDLTEQLGRLTPRRPAATELAQAIDIQTPPTTDPADAETDAVITPPQAAVDEPIGAAPTPATPSAPLSDSQISATSTPMQAADSQVSLVESQKPADAKQPAPATAKQSPWVINIASSQDKSDANRLAEKARASDFQTELKQVTVKGRQYWRVQITGFSTKEEATSAASPVKKALGLKDVWITTR